MSLNGKRDGFTLDDFRRVAAFASMKSGRAERIAGEVREAVQRWPELAATAGIDPGRAEQIARTHRLDLR